MKSFSVDPSDEEFAWVPRSPQARLLGAQLLVGLAVAVGLTAAHPYPLEYPDPAQYGFVVGRMLERGALLVTWDPPLRYFLHFDLALVLGGSAATVERVGVFQAAIYGYVLVPLSVYGLFSTIRGPSAGLAGAVAVTVARVARLPPTAVVWHHWQVDTGYPFALAALALAVGTVRAHESNRRRRAGALAGLTAGACGLTVNAEPWIALFATVGIAAAWVAYGAVGPLTVAGVVGLVAGAPVLLVPSWEAHLTRFVLVVVDPYGPLVTTEAFLAGVPTPGTLGVLVLFGGMAVLARRGTPVPGGWVIAFAILAGLVPWALFQVTALSGIGTRGLYWSLLVGIPAAVLQVVDATDGDHLLGVVYRQLFESPDPLEWAVLLAVEGALIAVSVAVFLVTYAPPS